MTTYGWISGQYQGYRPYGEAGDGLLDYFQQQWETLSPEVQQQWRNWAQTEVRPRAEALASKFRSLPADQQEAWKEWVRQKFANAQQWVDKYRSLSPRSQQQLKNYARSRLAFSPRFQRYRSFPSFQEAVGYVPGDGCGCGGPAGFGAQDASVSDVGQYLQGVGSSLGSSIQQLGYGLGSAAQSVTGYGL